MSFSDLKKKSSLGSLTNKLVKEVEKMTKQGNGDERLWKPQLDKSGNGYAVIRFLPAPDGEDLPWVKLYSHAFQGPNGWYIENSRTTIGDKDPVSEYNSQLWNTGRDSDKDEARRQKRKLSYYSNIYVVKDSINPENEGKVFLFKYGKKIFDKITAAMQPEFEDEKPINPFDFWQGANFKLKIKKVAGYWNYDSSEFGRVEPLLDDDDALEAIWKKEYPLTAIAGVDQFKPYEELKKRMNYVLGLDRDWLSEKLTEKAGTEESIDPYFDHQTKGPEHSHSHGHSHDNDDSGFNAPDIMASKESAPEEDDTLSYFQRLAED